MRAWLLFMPILLFAQSSSQPSKDAPINNVANAPKNADADAPQRDKGAPRITPTTGPAPTQIGPNKAQQPSQPSSADKTSEVAMDPIVRYTFWLVIVGVLQFAALVI